MDDIRKSIQAEGQLYSVSSRDIQTQADIQTPTGVANTLTHAHTCAFTHTCTIHTYREGPFVYIQYVLSYLVYQTHVWVSVCLCGQEQAWSVYVFFDDVSLTDFACLLHTTSNSQAFWSLVTDTLVFNDENASKKKKYNKIRIIEKKKRQTTKQNKHIWQDMHCVKVTRHPNPCS